MLQSKNLDLIDLGEGLGLGTTSVQLSERKNGFLTPKRHQIKHLEFVISWFGTRGSEVQILSPRPIFSLSVPET